MAISNLTRRRVLAAGTAAALAPVFAARAADTKGFDLSSGAANVEAMVKMIGGLDGGTYYNYLKGQVFSDIPGEPKQHLYDTEGCSIDRFRALGDGAFEHYSRAISLARDSETGELLHEFLNPFTKQVNEPVHFINGPLIYEFHPTRGVFWPKFSADEPVIPPSESGELSFDWEIEGDTVWHSVELITGLPNPVTEEEFPDAFTGPWIRFFDHYTVCTSLNELLDDELPAANSQQTYHLETNWYPWMLMGDRPGGVSRFAAGKKFFSVDDLPEHFREDGERLYPEIFINRDRYVDYTNRHLEFIKRERACRNEG